MRRIKRFGSVMGSLFLGASLQGWAAETQVHDIKKITVYEESHGNTHARIILLGATTLNPDDNTTPCTLWIKSTAALKTAFKAVELERPVVLTYEARGDAPGKCRVTSVTIKDIVNLSMNPAVELAKRDDRVLHAADSFNQEDVDIVMLTDNSYIAVWVSGDATGDGQVVQGQRFNKNMYADGSVFQISSSTPPVGQRFHSPQIAALSGGNFAVAWQLEDPGVSEQLYYRVLDAAQAEVKAETRVGSLHTSAFLGRLIPLADGGFGMVSVFEDENKLSVNLYDALGEETHAHLSADHTPLTSAWRRPSMVEANDGGLFIGFGVDETRPLGIRTLEYTRETDVLSNRALVGDSPPDEFFDVKLVMPANLEPLMAFQSRGDVYVQHFSQALGLGSDALQVNTDAYTIGGIEMVSLKDGSILVAWQDDGGADGAGKGIFARRIATDGTHLSETLQLSDETTGDQTGIRLLQSGDDGDVVAVWESDHGSDKDIYVTQIGVGQVATRPTTGTRVGRVSGVHPEDDPLTYSLADDAEERFKIHSTTGVIRVRTRLLINHNQADSHTIRVRVTDGETATTSDYTINVVE